MTTGRINQVAFLTDASVARGRRTRRARASSRGDDRQSFGAGDGRRFRAKRRPCVRPPALLVFRIRELRRQLAGRDASPEGLRLGTRTRLRGSPRAAPPMDGGQRRENVQRCDVRIPSVRYATQEARVRPRLETSPLRRRLRRNACGRTSPLQRGSGQPKLAHRYSRAVTTRTPRASTPRAGNPRGSPVPARSPGSCNVKARSSPNP